MCRADAQRPAQAAEVHGPARHVDDQLSDCCGGSEPWPDATLAWTDPDEAEGALRKHAGDGSASVVRLAGGQECFAVARGGNTAAAGAELDLLRAGNAFALFCEGAGAAKAAAAIPGAGVVRIALAPHAGNGARPLATLSYGYPTIAARVYAVAGRGDMELYGREQLFLDEAEAREACRSEAEPSIVAIVESGA